MAREFQRGHKARISDLTAGTDLYVGVHIAAPGLTFDISCFGLDGDERLSDDRYFVFFNQPKSPEEALQLLGAQAGDTESFRVTLDEIPPTIQRLSFTASIDGEGQMSQIGPGYLRIVAGGEEVARYSFDGPEFTTERSVVLGEFYRKDAWRFAAVGQGFDGGLDTLIKNLGGEIAEEREAAPPTMLAVPFALPTQGGPVPAFALPSEPAAPPAFRGPAPVAPQPAAPQPTAPQPHPVPPTPAPAAQHFPPPQETTAAGGGPASSGAPTAPTAPAASADPTAPAVPGPAAHGASAFPAPTAPDGTVAAPSPYGTTDQPPLPGQPAHFGDPGPGESQQPAHDPGQTAPLPPGYARPGQAAPQPTGYGYPQPGQTAPLPPGYAQPGQPGQTASAPPGYAQPGQGSQPTSQHPGPSAPLPPGYALPGQTGALPPGYAPPAQQTPSAPTGHSAPPAPDDDEPEILAPTGPDGSPDGYGPEAPTPAAPLGWGQPSAPILPPGYGRPQGEPPAGHPRPPGAPRPAPGTFAGRSPVQWPQPGTGQPAAQPEHPDLPPGQRAGVSGVMAAFQPYKEAATGRRWTQQSEKLIRADLAVGDQPVLVRQGSMVLHQGKVDFGYRGAGFGGRVGDGLGQETQLMRCSGHGQVFLAEDAAHLHPVELQGDALCVSAENVLAFDENLRYDARRIEGPGIPGGVLFTVQFQGTGTVVVKTHGVPVVLPVTPTTFADCNAVVAWSASCQVAVAGPMGMPVNAHPGAGGESVSLQFRGAPGNFIVVQPYEA